jgi:hypothetical protein
MAEPSRVHRALDYEFTVAVEGDDALRAYVSRVFAALPSGTGEPVPWLVREREDHDGWELVVGADRQASGATAARLVPELVHRLNAIALPTWDGVVCHAGGVVREGVGIVLPADVESGKSTLTAGLVRAGFGYLTDEGVAFRRDTALIEPFPKPLSLDAGSWFLFPELEPDEDLGSDDYKREQWQVPPDAIRPGCVAGPCAARVVVFPQYVEDAASELVPMRRAEALIELAKNTFAFNQQSRFALEQLAEVIRAVDCFRLTVGALDDAVALIEDLVVSLPVGAHADV